MSLENVSSLCIMIHTFWYHDINISDGNITPSFYNWYECAISELDQLTGVAAILRFPMPELEDEEDWPCKLKLQTVLHMYEDIFILCEHICKDIFCLNNFTMFNLWLMANTFLCTLFQLNYCAVTHLQFITISLFCSIFVSLSFICGCWLYEVIIFDDMDGKL